MFTSLRSRLWLSYALVITVSLTIVALVLLIFLIRNPLLSRQAQQKLRSVQSVIVGASQRFIDNTEALSNLADENDVRILVFNSDRVVLMDTASNNSMLPFPRRNVLNRASQTTIDENGQVWLYITSRLSNGQVLMVAAPRPRVPVFNIFTDEFLIKNKTGIVLDELAIFRSGGFAVFLMKREVRPVGVLV